jgi:glycosyltransferase involved in cell wall biosynthesis
MNEIITFIIPTIGRTTLTRTVNSLINQTNSEWNAIIIFDGIEKIEFPDKRITSISIPKTGKEGAIHGESGLVRNAGLKLVDTEWVGFLDDDDTIHAEYVEKLKTDFIDNDFVIWRMKFKNGNIIPRPNNNTLRFGNVGISFCYNRNKIGTIYFKTNRNGEDFDMISQLINKSSNYTVTKDSYYFVAH